MPQTFKIKSSSVEGKAPVAGDLATAELALNLKDQKLYSKDADGNVFEIGQAPEVNGFVKLNDEGTGQSIVGGGGLGVTGPVSSVESVTAGGMSGGFLTGVVAGKNGNLTIVNRSSGNLIDANYSFSGTIKNFVVDQNANLTTDGAITAVFGTDAAQRGNVAPLNDWSCYPARTTTYYAPPAPPAPPAPAPEPVDPNFGVDEPTFSAGFTSGGIVGTQDIIDLEGE